MSLDNALRRAIEECGWDDSTCLRVILSFLDRETEKGARRRLADHLDQIVDEETEYEDDVLAD